MPCVWLPAYFPCLLPLCKWQSQVWSVDLWFSACTLPLLFCTVILIESKYGSGSSSPLSSIWDQCRRCYWWKYFIYHLCRYWDRVTQFLAPMHLLRVCAGGWDSRNLSKCVFLVLVMETHGSWNRMELLHIVVGSCFWSDGWWMLLLN